MSKTASYDFNINTFKNGISVILFSASWCGPCKVVKPAFKKYSEINNNNNKYNFFIIDIDSDNDDIKKIVDLCKINQVPTMHFFKNGHLIENISIVGNFESKKLTSLLDNIEKI